MIPAVSSTFQCILDIYQACLARGEFARVILETKDGKEKVSFYSCEKGYPTPARREFQPGKAKKKKSPSDIARSRKRREAWLRAKETTVTEISTPAHCSRTRPFIPVSRGHQISDIPQLDGEVLIMGLESQITEQSANVSQSLLPPDVTMPEAPLQEDPPFEKPLPKEPLQETPLKEAPLLEEPLSDNSVIPPQETAPQLNPHPHRFNPPPTPPPMLHSLPTYWRKVICKECLQYSHDYSYYHCWYCHENGPDWYKKSSK
jgi:hypothetical protein